MIRRRAETKLITTSSRKFAVGNCRFIVVAETSHTDSIVAETITPNTTARNGSSQHLTPIQILPHNAPVYLSLTHTSTCSIIPSPTTESTNDIGSHRPRDNAPPAHAQPLVQTLPFFRTRMNPTIWLPSHHKITRSKDTLATTVPHTPDAHTLGS